MTIPADGSETVHITDTYHQFGSLLVTKTIAGPAAGQQGSITIHTVCDGTALTPDFVIAAGAPAGEQTMQYDEIPAPAKCTVTETADGHTSAVSVVVDGERPDRSPSVSVRSPEADILDTYGLAPGQLEVTKTIAGPLAGLQGTVVVHTVCDGTPLTPDLVIGGATPAGDYVAALLEASPRPQAAWSPRPRTGTPAPSRSPSPAAPPPPASRPAVPAPPISPTPTVTLPALCSSPRASPVRSPGNRGRSPFTSVCNGTALSPDFVIGAGSAAGSVSHSFDGIPAGSACTVTETADGGTTTVAATRRWAAGRP